MTIEYIGNSGKDPDNILRQAIGELRNVVLIGYPKNEDDPIYIAADTKLTIAEINWLVDHAKKQILCVVDEVSDE